MAEVKFTIFGEDKSGPVISDWKNKISEAGNYIKDEIKTSITIWSVALISGVSAAVLGVIYSLYKASSFIVGLFTGESYKSKSIDAVIAVNNEVKSLQQQLQLTAVDANALNDAMTRLGVNKADIVTVYQNSAAAIRTNRDELDRLGVAFTDQEGKLLITYEIVSSAVKKLDEYTAGWDRNQAAVAMGLGSYEQLQNYLKLNQEELKKSKEQLDKYNLGIGTEAQQAISDYQTAMLEFNNELKLMGDGFKRAWSDQIMPAFTTLATYLKDGWPIFVNIFRYTIAQLISLAYGLKMVCEIVYESIDGTFSAIGKLIMGAARATGNALRGDFAGAAQALASSWDQAGNRINVIGDNIVKAANKNAAAMKLAWGFDNRTTGNNFQPDKTGKAWVPKPADDTAEVLSKWAEKARAIIGLEKERISVLLNMERNYLEKVKTSYQSHVEDLQQFVNVVREVYKSMADRDKAEATRRAALLRGPEDGLNRYKRLQTELLEEESKIDGTWADPAEKIKRYNDLITTASEYNQAVVDNNIEIISSAETERDYMINKLRLSEKIRSVVEEETRAKEAAAIKDAENMMAAEARIKRYENRIQILDDMLRNLPQVKNIDVNVKINGLQDLYNISSLMNNAGVNQQGTSYGDYYTQGGKTYWADGSLAEDGTGTAEPRAKGGPVKPYATYRINEDGTEYLTLGNKGGYITPADKSPGGSGGSEGITIQGGLNLSFPNLTKITNAEADDIARMIYSKVQRLSGNRLSAARA